MNCTISSFCTLLLRRIHKDEVSKEKSNSLKLFMPAILFAIVTTASLLVGCSDSTGNRSFSSSDEAVKAYSACLSNIRKEDKVPIERLTTIVSEWQVIDDSVYSCLKRDTVNRPHRYPMKVYRQVKDSIHEEFIRLAASRPRSYHDLLFLKEHTSIYMKDVEIRETASEAQPFFTSLDSLPINCKGGKDGIVERYRIFLNESLKKGIHSREDLLDFIRKEHCHYRAFLQYLPQLADKSLTDITHNTEQCCVQILTAADKGAISHEDAMIFLAIRTNLRLLRSAQTAMSDLKSGKVKSQGTAHAYLWMLIQPFASMDNLSLAVMSDQDKNDLYKVADAMPSAMSHLAKTLRIDKQNLSEMPTLLMKIYLTRL